MSIKIENCLNCFVGSQKLKTSHLDTKKAEIIETLKKQDEVPYNSFKEFQCNLKTRLLCLG